MRYDLTLAFQRGYIAEPYWPAMEKVINIQKESGMNRVRSASRRAQSLKDYLAAHDMELVDYEQLVTQSRRPFYTLADTLSRVELEGLPPDEIVVPGHQLYGALAGACAVATSSVRLATVENLRTVLTVSDFRTGKFEADGTWERYVTVKGGSGTKLSNQRALRTSQYISAFEASGWVRFSEDMVSPQRVQDFWRFTGREVGVGASRKMNWGRFQLTQFEPSAEQW